jgi:DNA polymerase III subunit gamma/tau
MDLYNKYRPQTFGDVVGNENTVNSLKGLFEKNKIPHAFLMTGPTGCGKTTLARIIARELGAGKDNYVEINTADFRGIDMVRDLRRQAQYKPMGGSTKVWLLDECHKLSNDAQNGLLKLLEDAPSHAYYIFATTNPEKLLKTLKGRCSQFSVDLLGEKDMFRLLRKVVKSEGENMAKAVYEQITKSSQGHVRNALQILEQVLHVEEDKRLEMAKKAEQTENESIELCRMLLVKESWKKIANVLQSLKKQNEDAEGIRRHVLGYAQSVLLKSDNAQAAVVIEAFWEPTYNVGFPGLVYSCYESIK